MAAAAAMIRVERGPVRAHDAIDRVPRRHNVRLDPGTCAGSGQWRNRHGRSEHYTEQDTHDAFLIFFESTATNASSTNSARGGSFRPLSSAIGRVAPSLRSVSLPGSAMLHPVAGSCGRHVCLAAKRHQAKVALLHGFPSAEAACMRLQLYRCNVAHATDDGQRRTGPHLCLDTVPETQRLFFNSSSAA